MIRLKLIEPGSSPRPLEFEHLAVIIGRSNDCLLTIEDSKASRLHCQIVSTSHGVELVDLGSSNGTLVNGVETRRQTLRSGDKIQIGKTMIIYTDGSPAVPEPGPVRVSPALSETPPAGIKAPTFKPNAVNISRPAPHLPAPRPSSARLKTTRPRHHVLPLLMLLSVVGAGAVVLYYVVVKPAEHTRTGPSSDLLSSKGESENAEWLEFERLDAQRRAEQKQREEEIVREAREREARARDQAVQYTREEDRQKKAAQEATRKKAEAAREKELARKRKEAEERAKRRSAEAKVFALEKARFDKDVVPEVAGRIKKFDFDVALERLREFQADVKTEAGVELAVLRADEVNAMASAFRKMVRQLEPGDEITLLGRSVKVRKATEKSISGTMGSSSTTRKWSKVPPEEIVEFFNWIGMTAEDFYGAALLCFEHGLEREGEYRLSKCVKKDPSRKMFLDLVVARYRGVDPPPGGFLVYLDRWVTAKEKELLDKGYRRYNGKWMTEEEINKAKGLVKVGDEWMTPEEARRKAEMERKIAKISPKGYINREGYYDGRPWSEAIVIETAHYKIKSNLKKEAIEDAGYIMEWLYWNFCQVFRFRKRMQRFEVWIGGSHKDYTTHGQGRGAALGHCTSGGVISTFYQPPITLLVLMHEGTHQFIFRIAPTCPLWMHEGMATFFECSKFKVDVKRRMLKLQTGLLNRNRCEVIQRSIRDKSVASLDDFIHGRKGDPYSQGWAFVYYIVNAHKGRYSRYWLQFLEDVGKGSDPMKWFRKWLGVRDLAAFEVDWKKFIMALDPSKGEDQDIGHK